jgi:tetratricopeptide (TPR) repeat protein
VRRMSWFRRWLRGGRGERGDADTLVRKALRCVLEGELDTAEELLGRAVRIDSDQVDAYLSLARLYRLRGEIGRAIRVHQNLLLRTDIRSGQRDEALLGLAGDFRGASRSVPSLPTTRAAGALSQSPIALSPVRLADVRDYRRASSAAAPGLLRASRGGRGGPAAGRDGGGGPRRGAKDEERRALRRALRKDPAAFAPDPARRVGGGARPFQARAGGVARVAELDRAAAPRSTRARGGPRVGRAGQEFESYRRELRSGARETWMRAWPRLGRARPGQMRTARSRKCGR